MALSARFPGRCSCGARFATGASIDYDKASRAVTGCPGCRPAGAKGASATNGAGAARIEGRISKLLFAGAGGFAIARLADGTSVKGALGAARDGDDVALVGSWAIDPKWGRQFVAAACEVRRPADKAGAAKFFERFDGIGPARASKLVDALGVAGAFTAIDTGDVLTVAAAAGVTEDVARGVVRQAADQRSTLKAVLFLVADCGLTHHAADRAIKALRDSSVGPGDIERFLRANPYVLIDHVQGFGWERADSVARRLGVAPDAPVRIEAGWRHAFRLVEESEGHTAASPHRALHGAGERSPGAVRILGLAEAVVRDALRDLIRRGVLVEYADGSDDDDGGDEALLQRCETAAAEATIAARLGAIQAARRAPSEGWVGEAREVVDTMDALGALAGSAAP